MDYMTLKEASKKWGVTPRRVNYYCADGRIPGAIKMATIWLIPKDAEKPIDGRTKQGRLKHEQCFDYRRQETLQVNYFCTDGRIFRAVKTASVLLIYKSAKQLGGEQYD